VEIKNAIAKARLNAIEQIQQNFHNIATDIG